MALSRPRDRRNISAPNWCRADIVEGVGSVSCSQRSCVSRVVRSVSVDEWWPLGTWGVGLPVSRRRQVQRLSTPAFKQRINWECNPLTSLVKCYGHNSCRSTYIHPCILRTYNMSITKLYTNNLSMERTFYYRHFQDHTQPSFWVEYTTTQALLTVTPSFCNT